MVRSCLIFENKVVQSSLYGKNFKRNNEPIHDKKHLFFKFLRYGIILWGGDKKIKIFLNLQKRVLHIISGVRNRTSCRHIFKDYDVLTLPSLYILQVVCFIKKHKYVMVKSSDIHNYKTQRKLNLHVQYCNTVLFKKSVMNMGISLYNNNHIKQKNNFNSFKKGLRSLLLKHSFYSVDEFVSFKVLSVLVFIIYCRLVYCFIVYSRIMYLSVACCKLYTVCVWWYCEFWHMYIWYWLVLYLEAVSPIMDFLEQLIDWLICYC
jgi:hypothetical protein